MKTKITVGCLLLAGILAVARAQTKPPAALLQEGLYAEQTEGNLDRAIEIYSQIRDIRTNNPWLLARAGYQLGLCHLKKGQTEKAAEYFEEVLTYYPEQKSIAEKAKAELEKIKPAGEQEITEKIIAYVRKQHVLAYQKAREANIRLNSIAYYIDESGKKTQAGFLTFENETGAVMDSETGVGSFSHTNIEGCYDEKLQPQSYRLEESGSGVGRYTLLWTPERPIQPGEVVTLIYQIEDEFIPKIDSGYRLEMTHHFGSEVLENFFLVLPRNMSIAKGLDHLTSHQRIEPFDVYLWQERIPEDTTHSRSVDLEIQKEVADAEKPTVMTSCPETYSNDVDPALGELAVTFDQDMIQHGWAWVMIAGSENFPEGNGSARYIDARTCVLPVKLRPGKSYLVSINSDRHQAFRNVDQIPARQYALVFATADEWGNPTEIDPVLLQKAQQINARNAIPESVLDIVPAGVRQFIAEHFYQTHQEALSKGLRTNSHVHVLDQDFNRNFGMVQVFKNTTGKVIDHEISMGRNDSPEMYIYDEHGIRQKIRTYKIPGSNYRFFWTPSTPVQPDEERMLFYSSGSGPLHADADGRCKLTMNNHYGSPVIETFYLVLPSALDLAEQSEPFTDRQGLEGFEVYCWSREQGMNESHQVEVVLVKK